AVEFLHSIKLIHTDLKPENVLLKSWEDRSVTLESGDHVLLSFIVAVTGGLRSYNIASKPAIYFVTNSCFLPGTFVVALPGYKKNSDRLRRGDVRTRLARLRSQHPAVPGTRGDLGAALALPVR
ncbi:unnamed protein product, partial [Ectocarpus sp. 13 AM-2016]